MARITQLSVKGYRSISEWVEIKFPAGRPLVLLGENNAGKSNIVRALNLLLGQFSPAYYDPEDHDFYGRDRQTEIQIAATFDDYELLGDKWSEIHWHYNEALDQASTFRGVSPSTTKSFVSNADRDSCACMLIEADRNLRYQLSYRSKFTFLSRLMHRFHRSLMTQERIKEELEVLFENTKAAFKRLPEFRAFADRLQEELTNLVSSMTYKLEVDFEAYNPVNFFHALDLHASEGGQPRTLDEMGTGEQQVLAIAFAHAYAKSFHTGVLLVIEEPEAHLHPLAQDWLAQRLSDLCADGLQLVITTHSPSFVEILNLEGLALVRKNDRGTSITQIDRDFLVSTCVASGVPDGTIDTDNVLPFYAANVTKEILEGFFAKTVVLVEGLTESLALPIYLSAVGLDTPKEGIAVIPVHGKGNLAKWNRLFSAFDIPCFVVFDNDVSTEDQNGSRRSDALLAVGINNSDEHDTYISSTDWIISNEFSIFASGFETILRAAFPAYGALEDEARQNGVESKPLIARYVAVRLTVDDAPGWTKVRELKDVIHGRVT